MIANIDMTAETVAETVAVDTNTIEFVVEKKVKTKAKKNRVVDLENTQTSNQFSDLVAQYTAAFKFFNEQLFEGKLKMPMITIQSQGRRSCYGWFWANRWSSNNEAINEINMAAENINRSKEAQCETLIHEMVHLYNSQEGLKDCNQIQYHNRHFKTAAEMAGLKVEKITGKGWALTSLGDKAAEAVNKLSVKFVENINRPKMQSSYTKMYFVSVAESDQKAFRKLCIDQEKTQKEMFAELLSMYEQTATSEVNSDNTNNEEE